MNDQTIRKATGRSGAEWFDRIRAAGKSDASHREIAEYLQGTGGVSAWWAQEITVEFEKKEGRRVLGQTQDGLFQLGVSKTIAAPAREVWERLSSPLGIDLLVGEDEGTGTGRAPPLSPQLRSLEHLDADTPAGVRASTTTFAAGSHVRIRWQRPGWPGPSILQIRVTPKGRDRSVLAFHQEKLPSLADREELTERWRRAAATIARACEQGA